MYIISLCWYFLIFSFLGWFVESMSSLFSEKKFRNKGFLTLPLCPSYGICSVILYVIISKISSNNLVIYALSTVIISLMFIIIGIICEKTFGFKPWDFSDVKFCIGSYMTVPYSLLLGFIGLVTIKIVMPVIDSVLLLVPFEVSVIVLISFAILLIVDFTFSFVTIFRLRKRIHALESDAELIDEDVTQAKLDEIKENYNRLFVQNVLRKRITQAFPELKKRVYIKVFADKLEELKNENMKEYTMVYENKDDKPFAFGLCFTKLFYLFMIGSVAGTLMETVWALFAEGHFEIRVGMVYGPLIPVYGGGAVLLTLVLYKLYKLNDTLIYIISAFVGAGFEYFCSWFQEIVFGTVSWDYSDTPFNLNGRTNLMFALIWGLLGLIWVRYLYPWASKLIEKMPKKAGSIITICLLIFMVFNTIMSFAASWRWEARRNNIPAQSSFEKYLDKHFDDDKMKLLFPHMSETKETKEYFGSATADTAEKYTTTQETYTVNK